MATRISNLDLIEKCRRFITTDIKDAVIRLLIKDALATSNREISNIDTVPLAWLRERYNELFTRAPANISAITQANPCVITAQSKDSDISGHGFEDDDIVYMDNVGGMEELNRRIFRVDVLNSTTAALYQVNDQIAISSSGYTTYTSGGKIYHAGIKIPHATIEPAAGTADYKWIIKNVFAVTFDMYPAYPVAEESVVTDIRSITGIARPDKWRYKRYGYSTLDSSYEHYLMFNNPADDKYNIEIHIEKDYPDLSTWTAAVYPPHPPEVHDCIWRRALMNLTTNADKQKREGKDNVNAHVEVLYGQFWAQNAVKDVAFIKNFSRSLSGSQPVQGLGVRFNSYGFTRGGSGLEAAIP